MEASGSNGSSIPPPAKRAKSSSRAPALDQFVRTVLLQTLLKRGDALLELSCGKGRDMGKFQRAFIGSYVGVEPNAEARAEAEETWRRKQAPFTAEFVDADPLDQVARPLRLPQGAAFDGVLCFGQLHQSFASEALATAFLKGVSAHLKDGGFFFGCMPDPAHVWNKAQKSILRQMGEMAKAGVKDEAAQLEGFQPSIANHVYKVALPDCEFSPFGCQWELTVGGGAPSAHYYVHYPTLLRLAAAEGLELVSAPNFVDFYEDYKAIFWHDIQKLGVASNER